MLDDRVTMRERYLEQMVESATPERLLMMLLDGAVGFINRASLAFEGGRLDEVNECLVKAQNIFIELVLALDLNAGQFAENLARIYEFVYNLLIEANIEKNPDKIKSALRLAGDVRDLWKETIEKSRQESLEEAPPIDSPAIGAQSGEPVSRLNVTA